MPELKARFRERWPNAISISLHANVTTTNGRHFSSVKKTKKIKKLGVKRCYSYLHTRFLDQMVHMVSD